METTIDLNADYVLENERVLLRPLQSADFVNLIRFSIDEPELWKYSLIPASGAENLTNYIHAAINNRAQQKEYCFIVFDKQKNEYAGCTRFYDINPEYKTLQLGYTWYGKNFQGTGVNKNCKFLLLQHAFEKWKIERVEFRADNENERSKAAMLSIGCKVEGVLRSHMPKKEGGRRDSIVLSILKYEWENTVKEMLRKKL